MIKRRLMDGARPRPRLLKLQNGCPKCGVRPNIRVSAALRDALAMWPLAAVPITYQCQQQGCSHVYDVSIRSIQGAVE